MNGAVNFLLESGVSLSLLSLIYILFLRKETFFRLNRIFLLLALVFSVVLPFLKFRVYEPQSVMLAEVTVTPYRNLIEGITVHGQDFSGAVVQTVSSSRMIVLIYLAGLMFFVTRLVYRLVQVTVLIFRNRVKKVGGVKFVYVDKDFSPFSFLRYVFVNGKVSRDPGYKKMVTHELEHIKQGHTFDVLMLEILSVLQWFNPFMWILKRVIRENHEFLADRAVLNTGISVAGYKKLLLNQAVGYPLEIANSFNSSLIKKRIKMISKIRSSKMANLKYVFGVFTVLALVIAFACEQKESTVMEETLTEEGKSLKLTFQDEYLKFEGTAEDIARIEDIFSGATGFKMVTVVDGNNILLKKSTPKKISTDDEIFFIVEEMPEFPGGDNALRKFIASSVRYPEEAQEKGIQGKVYVSFVVSKDGSIANAKIARGVDPYLDGEALRVINSQPRWTPGKQKGEAVNVQFTVPINFVLQ